MANDVSGARTEHRIPGPLGSAPAAEAPRPWRPWWLIMVLAVVVSLVAGACVQHAVDQHKAAITLYRNPGRHHRLPVLHRGRAASSPCRPRSAALAPSASWPTRSARSGAARPGRQRLRPALTVRRRLAGSTDPARQVAFAVTVSSPHGSKARSSCGISGLSRRTSTRAPACCRAPCSAPGAPGTWNSAATSSFSPASPAGGPLARWTADSPAWAWPTSPNSRASASGAGSGWAGPARPWSWPVRSLIWLRPRRVSRGSPTRGPGLPTRSTSAPPGSGRVRGTA